MPTNGLDQKKICPLPEASGSKPPWYTLLWRRSIVFCRSSLGITWLIGTFLFLALSVILSVDYLAVIKVAENGISKQNFFAPYDLEVVDENSTQLRIEQARQNVPPIYRSQGELDTKIHLGLQQQLAQLQAISQDSQSSMLDKKEQFQEILGETPDVGRLFGRYFKNNRGPDNAFWERVQFWSDNVLNTLLKRGVTAEDYYENKEQLIETAMPKRGISEQDKALVRLLVGSVLHPNRVLDEEAMEQSRRVAEIEVKPITRFFRKGEKIVGQGEPMTPIQIDALEKLGKSVKGINWLACLGVVLLANLFAATLWGYLYYYESHRFFNPQYGGMIVLMTLGTILIFKGIYYQHDAYLLYALPLATYALTLSIFTHPRIAILATTLLVFLLTLSQKIDFYPMSTLLFGSVVGVFSLSRRMNFSDRNHLMLAGFYVCVTNLVVIIALHLLNETSTLGNQWSVLLNQLAWGAAGGLFSGVLTMGILPYLESMFRLVTPYTLMELGNHDKPLLKRLQFEAPGTFHHSLMVASLAEAAAEAIGANTLLTRVGALYHDIGKMKRPTFFIENQAYFGVENPHDKLTPRLSKMIITAHPKDSLEMARQYRLPEVIMKFMTEHHGTLVAGYFYNLACQQEGAESVVKDQFRYPGPKPDIKETAIVMMADACESAVRSMKTPTVLQIEERIEKLINQRVEDGQFDNCPITYRDVHTVKETFMRVLRGVQHNRIEYPQAVMQELRRKFSQTGTPPNQEGVVRPFQPPKEDSAAS